MGMGGGISTNIQSLFSWRDGTDLILFSDNIKMCPNKGPKKKVSKSKTVAPTEEVQPTSSDLGSTCCVPRGQVSCSTPDILDKSSSIRMICSNLQCTQAGLMHQKCYNKFESLLVVYLGKQARSRDWSSTHTLGNLWISRGYDLVYKLCACECGHGHIRRDLDHGEDRVEGAVANQADLEKKKKKKSEVVKPKLNCRRDKVSQQSVGNFSYFNKPNKDGKEKHTRTVLKEFKEVEPETSSFIPGLQPSLKPLTLNLDLPALEPKPRKTSVSMSSSGDCDEGWITVSKSSGRKGVDQANEQKTGPKKVSSKIPEPSVEEDLFEVYESDEDIVESVSDNVVLDICSGEHLSEASIEDVSSSYSNNNGFEQISDTQLEEMLGNLVAEKLGEEIAKNKALAEVSCLVDRNRILSEAFLTEKSRWLQDIQILNESITELRKVSKTRETLLQLEVDDLGIKLHQEIADNGSVQAENGYLNRLVKCIECDKEKVATEFEVERTGWKVQIAEAGRMVKFHENVALEMLGKEREKMLRCTMSMEERLQSLGCTAEDMKKVIENLLLKNGQAEENLLSEKKMVQNLSEKLKMASLTEFKNLPDSVVENDLATNIIQQMAQKDATSFVKEGFQSTARSSQLTPLDISRDSAALVLEMLQKVKDETRQTKSKVELLEGTVQTLEIKQQETEKDVSIYRNSTTGSANNMLKGMKDKILGLVKDCDQFGEMSVKMASAQVQSHKQILYLDAGVDQQNLENDDLRAKMANLAEKMAALENDMKPAQRQRSA